MSSGMWTGINNGYNQLRQDRQAYDTQRLREEQAAFNRQMQEAAQRQRLREFVARKKQQEIINSRYEDALNRQLQTERGNRALAMNPGLAKRLQSMQYQPGTPMSNMQGPPVPGLMDASLATPDAIKAARDYMSPEQKFAQLTALQMLKNRKPGAKSNKTFQKDILLPDGTTHTFSFTVDANGQPISKTDLGVASQKIPQPETEYSKKNTQTNFTIGKDLGKQARVAVGMLPKLKVLRDADIYSGEFGDKVQQLRKFGAILGFNKENASLGDIATAAQNQLAMLMRNPDSGGGLPGAASERDVQFLLDSVPNLLQTPEGRKTVADMMYEIAADQIKLNKEYATSLGKERRNFNGMAFVGDYYDKRLKKFRNKVEEIINKAQKQSTLNPTPTPAPAPAPAPAPLTNDQAAKVNEYLKLVGGAN